MPLTIEDRTPLFDGLASLLAYPTESHSEVVQRAAATLEGWNAELGTRLAPLTEHVQSLARSDLEECYTRTFDISPECALEIGWHLYGENYTRGAFLVEMRGHLRNLGLAESAELPDHICHVLQVVGRLPEDEARELCRGQLLPALTKMQKQIPEGRPHACVFQAAEFVVREVFSIDEALTTGREDLPYFRELETLPPGCSSQCGGAP